MHLLEPKSLRIKNDIAAIELNKFFLYNLLILL